MEELKDQLLYAPKNGYANMTAEQRAEMNEYCKRYSAFMDACKTEREATTWTEAIAKANGFYIAFFLKISRHRRGFSKKISLQATVCNIALS